MKALNNKNVEITFDKQKRIKEFSVENKNFCFKKSPSLKFMKFEYYVFSMAFLSCFEHLLRLKVILVCYFGKEDFFLNGNIEAENHRDEVELYEKFDNEF
jgi:hypothetical protein